jgi:hypothetical protein
LPHTQCGLHVSVGWGQQGFVSSLITSQWESGNIIITPLNNYSAFWLQQSWPRGTTVLFVLFRRTNNMADYQHIVSSIFFFFFFY